MLSTLLLLTPSISLMESRYPRSRSKDTTTQIRRSYFKKINGTEYDASTYVFPKKEDDFIHKSYTIDLSDAPATDSLAFQISGKQCCLIITLETPTSTNIQKVVVNSEASKAHKYLDKGQVVIEKAGKKYSTAGQQLK